MAHTRATRPLFLPRLITLSHVRLEPWLEDFRPDIVVSDSETQDEICVEIAATYFVDETKLLKIKNRGLKTIEIDVSSARGQMDFALLNRFLFDVPSQGKWL